MKKHYTYHPVGVCSSYIEFDLEDNKVYNLSFRGGCNGNLKAIGKLVDGMNVKDVISKLKGNTCGYRPTSCADQFSKALEQAVKEG